ADVLAGGIEHRRHLRRAALAAPVPGVAVLVGERGRQLVDGIARQRLIRGCREREREQQAGQWQAGDGGAEALHFTSLAQRKPRLAVVLPASSEDSMATRISTA